MTSPQQPPWERKIYVGGWVDGAGDTADVAEPATGASLGKIGLASGADLEHAVSLAKSAQQPWAAVDPEGRAGLLRRVGEALTAMKEGVVGWLIREGGATHEKANFETDLAIRECYAAAALALHPTGEMISTNGGDMSYSVRTPAGILGVIAPFNAPLQLAIHSIAPAIALGNAAILKPDPRAAVSGGMMLAMAFEAAGAPRGILAVLPGGAELGEALVAHSGIDVVSFTGSTKAGRSVGQAAARHFAKAHLELGGNSALLVLPGVDIDWAAHMGARGSFFHQGQICMATGRHLVHRDVVDAYVERLAQIAANLRIGDPTDPEVEIGPIIDAHQRDRIHALVLESLEQGATLVTGGTYDELFYRPTVLTNVGPQTSAYANEIFGPVAVVRSFASDEEAVAMACDSEYGLTLGILTPDITRALDIAERIPTGAVHINNQTIADSPLAPMGGVQASGVGSHFGGTANLDAFTETRWVTVQPAQRRSVY
ncbi:aldehyde dehydrogenase family protein [Mycobacteroides immunogenum]|uniref:Benzaldehyde dehydrogenase n=1 Tax=Mycobacteroides immunogenum TaxID=83262 RepID=A0A7V8LJF6_9MYCO|nr:aldehyde dehydrogenase family protein [Mycobacteroides immunogenum]AMT71206.1 benzaldehyde dehydrogenase [Mycobacteroides immunogenum]ANO04315.1 benzaldehyde dehydrogenase [Mycobacteroides immunogenum]KIU37586.1 benzaldehyde dehydrogenase [Mycobacteroides immunogenum]KPG02410.1 benzaldehyde dehydrogenase [Mycobacteroides immunogenum]KPG02427.1 benzaldehyde dehydrogenase [Mycobacteroides immunogenum]